MRTFFITTAVLAAATAASAQDAAVKKAIDAKYAVFCQSAIKRDFAKMYSICAPGFQWVDTKGRASNAQQVQKAAADALTPLPPLTSAKTTIKGLKVKGDTATLENTTSLMVQGPPDEKGKRLTLELRVESSDTWKKNGSDWQWAAAKEKSLKRLMNGVEFGTPSSAKQPLPGAPPKPKGKGQH
jgi:hypothetical protein